MAFLDFVHPPRLLRRVRLAAPTTSHGALMPQTMRAFQIPRPGAPFQRVERPIPQPTPNTVRIKVLACGVCHSDSVVKEGQFPGIEYPRIPGHEVVGVI